MVARDRTAELHNLVALYRREGRGDVSGASRAAAQRQSVPPAVQRFQERAQAFSKELSQASLSLANLTKLIQQQSVFDDQAPEIGSLTSIVKARLSKMHDDLAELAEMRADAAIGPSTSQPNRHSEAVISTLRSKLVNTSNTFKSILQKRTKAIKDTHARRNQLSSDKPASFESALFRQQQASDGAYGAAAVDDTNHSGESSQLLATTQSHALANSNAQHYRSRYDAVRQLEQSVQEVGQMMSDFTRLVHEQDETIVRIDTEVDEAKGFIDSGRGELMRYIATLSTNRGMILKIFGVLFFFLLFFGFFVVK